MLQCLQTFRVLLRYFWTIALLTGLIAQGALAQTAPTCTFEAPENPSIDSTATVQRVYAYGVQNATSVLFPTWWIPGNQADLQWLQGVNAGNGTWYADVVLSQYDATTPRYGSFETGVYLFNSSYTNVLCGQGSWTRSSTPTGTNIYTFSYTTGSSGPYRPFATLDTAETAMRADSAGAYATAGLSFPIFALSSSGWQFTETLDYRPYGGLNTQPPAPGAKAATASNTALTNNAAVSPPPIQTVAQVDVVSPTTATALTAGQPNYKQQITGGTNPPPQAQSCTKEGDPCVLANGNQEQTDIDFTYGAVTFKRSYNALRMLKPYAGIDANWSATFANRVLTSTLTQSHGTAASPTAPFIVVQDEAGLAEFYKLVPSKSTASIGVFRATVREGSVLVVNPSASFPYVVYHLDGSQEWYDKYGRYQRSYFPEDPARDFDATYQTTTSDLTQQSNWLISAIEDGRLRVVRFSYGLTTNPNNPYSVLTSSTDPYSRNLAKYAYDSQFNLASVTYQDNSLKQYQYGQTDHFDDPTMSMPHNLTRVIDENGNDFADFGYDQHGRAVWSYEAGGANYADMDYTNDTSVQAVRALGDTIQYSFQNLATDQTARKPSSIVHTSAGVPGFMESWTYGYQDSTCVSQDERLCRHSDSHGVVTEHQYDDLFERVRIEGEGTSEQRRIETDYDESITYRPTQRRIYALQNGSEVLQSQTSYVYDTTYDSQWGVLRGMLLAKCDADPLTAGATAYVCTPNRLPKAPAGVRRNTYTYCTWNLTVSASQVGCPVGDLWLATSTDPNGNVTTYTYHQVNDSSGCVSVSPNCFQDGDLAYITNALGQKTVTFKKYYDSGLVSATLDVNNVETDYKYTPRNWIKSVTVVDPSATPSNLTTTFAYDKVGDVLSVTDPDNIKISYTYDNAHRLTDVTDASGAHIHYTLDALGNKAKEDRFDPSNNLQYTLSRTYDLLNRLSIVTDALSHATSVSYDSQNREVNSTDPYSRVSHQDYDGLNRLKDYVQNYVSSGSQSGTQNVTTGYVYDTRDNLVQVTDPDNLVTTYTYDGLNNLKQISSPDTSTTTYTYFASGDRQTQTDARNVIATYGYDSLNRVTSVSYPTSGLNVTYTYDAGAVNCSNTGKLTTITDNSGSTTYCYDRRGNVTKKIQRSTGASLITKYAYTSANRVNNVTYPSGAVVTYGRDMVGRISSVTFQPSGGTASTLVSNVTYYSFGPAGTVTFGNGHTLTKTFNQNYWMTGDVSSLSSGLHLNPTFDSVGNIGTIPVFNGNASYEYSYDNLYRLSQVVYFPGDPILLNAFTYDGTGDRLSDQTGSTPRTFSYANGTHRLSAITTSGQASQIRAYDANGNTTSRGDGITLTYDNRNRLVSAGATSYNYNGRGERVFKTGKLFGYDETGQLIGEYTTAGAAIGEYIYADGIPVGYASGGTLYYIETDQLGTPRTVIQPGATTASDTVVWNWDTSSTPFGENGPSVQTVAFNLRFPGQYFDSETGLNYNYFRDFEPGTGRYSESDPVGLEPAISTYGYAGQNPLRFKDLLGLWVKRCSRWLTDRNSPATSRYNPLSHQYINVSGLILSFTNGGGGQGRMDPNEDGEKGCNPFCSDDRFDAYVLAAEKEVGVPAYNWSAQTDWSLWALVFDAYNCQRWTDKVLQIAKENYLAHEKCPTCFR